jgi:hypothetical protein
MGEARMVNPAVLIGMAVVGLLAVMIYLGASDKNSKNIELTQEKQRLESMQFDKDFSDFGEGRKVGSPTDAELTAQKTKIADLEEKKRLADLEDEKRRAEMQKTLDNMAEGKISEN